MFDKSICHFGVSDLYFIAFNLFLMEIPPSQQCMRSDQTPHYVASKSWFALFVYGPFTAFQVRMG